MKKQNLIKQDSHNQKTHSPHKTIYECPPILGKKIHSIKVDVEKYRKTNAIIMSVLSFVLIMIFVRFVLTSRIGAYTKRCKLLGREDVCKAWRSCRYTCFIRGRISNVTSISARTGWGMRSCCAFGHRMRGVCHLLVISTIGTVRPFR